MAEESTTLYKIMFTICLFLCALLSLNRGVYNVYHSIILNTTGYTIHDYLIQPDTSLPVFLSVLLLSMYLPAVSGIAHARVRTNWKSAIRVCHFVTSAGGILSSAILVLMEAITIKDVGGVVCSYTRDHMCVCGLQTPACLTSVLVCGMFPVRIGYLILITAGFICNLVNLCLFLRKVKQDGKPQHNQVSHDSHVPKKLFKQRPHMSFVEYITIQHDLMMV